MNPPRSRWDFFDSDGKIEDFSIHLSNHYHEKPWLFQFFFKMGYQWGYPYKSMISTERHLPIDPRSQQSWWDQLIGGLFIIIYPIILLGFQQISTIQGGAAFIPSTVCSLKGELNCGSRLENLEFHPSGLGTGRGFLDFFAHQST